MSPATSFGVRMAGVISNAVVAGLWFGLAITPSTVYPALNVAVGSSLLIAAILQGIAMARRMR